MYFLSGKPRYFYSSVDTAVSSTLPIAAPASATASRELCRLNAGRRHAATCTVLESLGVAARQCGARSVAFAHCSVSSIVIGAGTCTVRRTRPQALSTRTTCASELLEAGTASTPPSAHICSINVILSRCIRARSSSGSTTARAGSSVIAPSLSATISRARFSSSCPNVALAVTGKLKPCRQAFRLARFLPADERGPVLLVALRLLAAICFSLAMLMPLPIFVRARFNADDLFTFDNAF